MCKQSAVMAVAHSKLFRLVVHLFDGVLRLWLFSHLVSFRPGFTCGSLDVIRMLFPPVCDLFSPYSVRAFLVVFLMLVYFAHWFFAPFARDDSIWSASHCLVFLFNQHCAFFAIPFGFENFAKKTAAPFAVFNLHAVLPLSSWLHGCAVQSTGSASFPSAARCLLRFGTRPLPLPTSTAVYGWALCKNTSPALTSLFDDERWHFLASGTAQADALGNPNVK